MKESNKMESTDIIFSINVHEKPNFLLKQLKNIEENVGMNYVVIINPNIFMYYKLSNMKEFTENKKVILNNFSDKSYGKGSLTQGIYLNMKLSLEKYSFKYFIVMSSRNLFYQKLEHENMSSLLPGERMNLTLEQAKAEGWHWPKFLLTKLSKHVIEKNLRFSRNAHEGLTFKFESCKEIVRFLEKENEIREDIFDPFLYAGEEFALQTICFNTSGIFYQIGNWTAGCHEDISLLPKEKFLYKTKRE